MARKAVAMALTATLGAVRAAIPQPPILQTRITNGECSETEPTGDYTYFPLAKQVTVDVSIADLFEINYTLTYKVILGKMAKEQYVLTQCGQTRPKDQEVDATFPLGAGYTRKYFTVPVQSAAAVSTVQLAFLAALEVQDRINYVASGASAPCWQKALGCGALLPSAHDTNTANQASRAVRLASVEVVFMDCGSNCDALNKQTNAVHLPASQEDDPLKTAEYIKFVAAFFNKDPQAEVLFHASKVAYRGASSAAPTSPPVVAWVAFQAAYPGWNPDQLVISTAAYKLKLVTDAGGANFDAATELTQQALPGLQVADAVYGKPAAGKTYKVPLSAFNDSLANASAALFNLLGSVNVLIDETYASNPGSYNIDTFYTKFALNSSSSLKFVQDRKVIRQDRDISESNGLDWFESRLARPDWAVEGLARVLHQPSKRAKYFRNIAADEKVVVLTQSMCKKELPTCSIGVPAVILLLGGNDPEISGAWPGRRSSILAAVVVAIATLFATGLATPPMGMGGP